MNEQLQEASRRVHAGRRALWLARACKRGASCRPRNQTKNLGVGARIRRVPSDGRSCDARRLRNHRDHAGKPRATSRQSTAHRKPERPVAVAHRRATGSNLSTPPMYLLKASGIVIEPSLF